MGKKAKLLCALFVNTLYISACTFGGGFVIVAFMKKLFVDKYHWLDEGEMLDISALAQSAPGAIAVNVAILVGWRMAGVLGMLAAVAGTVLPPVTLLTLLSYGYEAFAENPHIRLFLTGAQAGVAAVILHTALELGKSVVNQGSLLSDVMMAAAFCAVFFLKVNVMYVILAAVAVGMVQVMVQRRRRHLL